MTFDRARLVDEVVMEVDELLLLELVELLAKVLDSVAF